MTINWDDPAERLRLAEHVGTAEYNRLLLEHRAANVLLTVAGHEIRPAWSRFGRLFLVGDTGVAYMTLEQAVQHAEDHPKA